MFRKKNFFHSPAFNILATAVLVIALAVFYKISTTDYSDELKKNMETLSTERLNDVVAVPKTIDEALKALEAADTSRTIDEDLLIYCKENIRSDIYDRICEYMETNQFYDESMWTELCGYSLLYIYDHANFLVDEAEYSILKEDTDSFTLTFAGDVSLDTTRAHRWSPLMVHKNNRENLAEAAFSADLLEKMIGTDFFLLNLESPFITLESRPIDNKWRHGSLSENVDVLGILGVDMVNIANDKIYDYGEDGFLCTVNTLDASGIKYVGGGKNYSDDANFPRYIYACGKKIAIVSAAETNEGLLSPETTSAKPGILYGSNSVRFTDVLTEANANSDYVIVFTDWANGNNQTPDEAQVSLAHSYVDAGADIVIGTMGTVMQSIEYYNGVPIIYGIGNFWYETDRHEALLIELDFNRKSFTLADVNDSAVEIEEKTRYEISEKPDIYCFPCIQEQATVRLSQGTDEGAAVINRLSEISNGMISVSPEGLLSEVVIETPAE